MTGVHVSRNSHLARSGLPTIGCGNRVGPDTAQDHWLTDTSRRYASVSSLTHFLTAQSCTYPAALAELRAGHKRTHWMWFVFPQIAGLGRSEMARRFALAGVEAARDYLNHPVLGARLVECTEAVLAHAGRRSVHEIFGHPDDLKFHSSMTLFGRAAPPGSVFHQALAAFFDGAEDAGTLARLTGD